MHEVLVNRLGGLSLPRKSVVRLTERPDMTLDVYRGRKTTNQIKNIQSVSVYISARVLFQTYTLTSLHYMYETDANWWMCGCTQNCRCQNHLPTYLRVM